ncbi:MAG: EF-P lysine aminoacylase EpmA [Wenzhouxiangellaceae bacterium]
MTRPGARTLHWLKTAAGVRARIREYFSDQGVLEVQTPVITRYGVTDVHLHSVALNDGRFLRTSPEYAHKRLLAAGIGDLYELGPVFRAGEHSRIHREEFTMLEWYRVDWHWRRLADEVVTIIRLTTGLDSDPVRVSWRDLARQALGVDPLSEADALDALLDDAPPDLDLPERLDWLFAMRMQNALPTRGIAIVHDFPACQAALARLNPDDPATAERFEVFVNRVELANGYQELTDAVEQRRRFDEDNRRRSALGLNPMPVDETLLEAMARGLPECAGVALGVDRLVMLAAGEAALQDALD